MQEKAGAKKKLPKKTPSQKKENTILNVKKKTTYSGAWEMGRGEGPKGAQVIFNR